MNFLRQRLSILPFVAATLLGAFLVFQVQPVISKAVLPWFGGSPAVWTTCMLFFQVVLFAGYLYAHWLVTYVPRRYQGILHVGVLMAAVACLPIQPSDAWKPSGDASPVLYLLALLAVHVGLPYFILASTGPLVQAWWARRSSSQRVYRLYAFSNIGSLAALVSYPFLVEPRLSVDHQSTTWSLLFCTFALFQGGLAIWLGSQAPADSTSNAGDAPRTLASVAPSWRRIRLWILLPALASATLLSITNHVCQDVAVIPFLWVLPLSLYLLSFIICFDRPAWYRPRMIASSVLVITGLLFVLYRTPYWGWGVTEVVLQLALLMAVCMLCHGEVARLKPNPARLTQYYLCLSAGGAVGGLAVGLLCPLIFNGYFEHAICLGIAATVAMAVWIGYRASPTGTTFSLRRVKSLRFGLVCFAALVMWLSHDHGPADVKVAVRNFFGVLRVAHLGENVVMLHGRIMHGAQRLDGDMEPTTYYGRQSGIGCVLTALGRDDESLNVTGVGLGCGTLATYGRPDDQYEFVEINPEVIRLAQKYFGFIGESKADVKLTQGDGRLVLENRADGQVDVLALDAFSSDSVPAHLLTLEAFQLYKKCLKPSGILVVHVSNRYLDLPPVVHRLAIEQGWKSGGVYSKAGEDTDTIAAKWIVIAAPEHAIWDAPELSDALIPTDAERKAGLLWTDRYHDLLSLVRFNAP